MDWKIEATKATATADLRGALEASRDEWLRVTPQPEDKEAAEALDAIPQVHNDGRAPVVKMAATIVAKNNAAGHGPTFKAIKRQMDAAIACACSYVETMPSGSYVRATLSGHYRPGHPQYLDERANISIDLARPPV